MTYFKKPCKYCDELFRPDGRDSKVCDKCKEKQKIERKLKYEKQRKMRLKRPCIVCNEMFIPTSRYSRTCEDCKIEIEKLRRKKLKETRKQKLIKLKQLNKEVR